jgi:hypothetical protein
MGFSRPQLVVVSGLFQWESLDGWDFLGHNLLLSRASFFFFFFTMGFWLSRSFLTNFFFFLRWNSGYHEAFLTNFFFFYDGILAITKPFSRTFSFFTMEFWLSRSLSHELFLFLRWNSGYHEAFLTNFFFFYDGILAITKPFSQTFFFSTMEFWLSRSLSHELFLFFTMEFSRYAIWGKTLFIYIYIYHKEYLHRIRLVKNLAS